LHSVRSPSTRDEVKQVGDGDAGPAVRNLDILVGINPLKLFQFIDGNRLWPGRRLAGIVEMDATVYCEHRHHDGQEQDPRGRLSTPPAGSKPDQENGSQSFHVATLGPAGREHKLIKSLPASDFSMLEPWTCLFKWMRPDPSGILAAG
jgi:hypothetical protein